MSEYTLDRQENFAIEDYNKAKSFASFLPAIAGKFGIPLWCFYTNRAQCISSFGILDKDHSIVEFLPANKAYAAVFEKGFRTFLKTGLKIYEPFRLTPDNSSITQRLRINSSFLEIEETNKKLKLNIKVTYFTLPSEDFASLVRVVKITNRSSSTRKFEVLDGLSCIVPFGARNKFLKDLSRTLEAWMESSLKNDVAFFKLRLSPRDTSDTVQIKGANFYFSSLLGNKEKAHSLKLIVDTQAIFREDSGFFYPHNFARSNFKYPQKQILSGKMPCSFSYVKKTLKPSSSCEFVSFIGTVTDEKKILKLAKKIDKKLVRDKYEENINIVENIKQACFVKSSRPEFDFYIQQSFLDNVLRGGYPEEFKEKNSTCIHYLYSRKHGDLERDYNRFKLENTFLSSGEGNYRDLNQNRRCDNFFNPLVARENIHLFFNLQRADAYNPLVVKSYKFIFPNKKQFMSAFKDTLSLKQREQIYKDTPQKFSLGEFIELLKKQGISSRHWDSLVLRVITHAVRQESAEFGEGFWIDHWTYNLDLVENYLSMFADKEEELLFENKYFFYDDFCKINPLSARLYYKQGKVSQHNFLHFDTEKNKFINARKNFIHRLPLKNANQFYTNLVVKMLVIILNKVSSLDPFGLGIEMEAGKPGWCDALNGLPSLFGSSLAETFELKRLSIFLQKKQRKYLNKHIILPEQIYVFFKELDRLLQEARKSGSSTFTFWQKALVLKERYRENIFFTVSGKNRKISLKDVDRFLTRVIDKINSGLERLDYRKGIPTYYINEVTKYKIGRNGKIIPLKFRQKKLPDFLEGYVRALRVCNKREAKQIYRFLQKSPLYDKRLKMYKINASLKKEPLEIGRIRVFEPGWLENESIWLHMEYKYLLELIKAGLYKEFYKEFYNCFVCFQKPKIYGRSILENSSFIVSSAYVDKDKWGRGFVARLSGSTVEAINILILLCVGKNPFTLDKNRLFLEFKPALSSELFTRKKSTISILLDGQRKEFIVPKNSFCFKFLSQTLVIYYNPKRRNTFSQNAKIVKILIHYKNKEKVIIKSSKIPPPHSLRIRNREATHIEVYFS